MSAGHSNPPAQAGSALASPRQRLVSLDALRGFDMFWIVGGSGIMSSLPSLSSSGFLAALGRQFDHAEWEGMTFFDLIFPLFVFIAGVSLVFSLSRVLEEKGKSAAVRRILKRSTILFILGVIYSSGPVARLVDIRLLGVLQRIALCYFFAGVLFCTMRTRGMVAACVALLLGYWALMTFVPVPGMGQGNFEEGANLANYIDRQYLPFSKYDGDHDPEGLLSTLPAIATCLLGVFAGQLLRNRSVPDQQKVIWLGVAGAAGVGLGLLWGLEFPVIKKIWTSSYVLVAAGYSCLLLAGFHQVIQVWGLRGWAMPFVWIGRNPITMYLLFPLLAGLFWVASPSGSGAGSILGRYTDLGMSIALVALMLATAFGLDRKRIYLRL